MLRRPVSLENERTNSGMMGLVIDLLESILFFIELRLFVKMRRRIGINVLYPTILITYLYFNMEMD